MRVVLLLVALLGLGFSVPVAHADAQRATAAYEAGKYEVALGEFQRMAKAGNPAAQNNLAVMHANGQGVPKNMEKAAYWYNEAAEQGLPVAQYNLGMLYERGEGVPEDPLAAAVWYQLAASQGDVLSQYRLGVLFADAIGVERDDLLAYYWLSLAASRTPDLLLREEILGTRDPVETRLRPDEVEDARRMAREWRPGR